MQFGRGGTEGDVFLALAQFGAPENRDNAVMASFGDGRSPQMMMFVWSGAQTGELSRAGVLAAFALADFGDSNTDKNPLTLAHIADSAALPTNAPVGSSLVNNAEVHAAGEVWPAMMFEAYVALLERTQGPAL